MMMMAKKRKPKRGEVDEWEGLLDEGPRADISAEMPKSNFFKRMLRPFMWVSIIGFVPLLFLFTGTIVNNQSRLTEIEQMVANQQLEASSPGRSAATRQIEMWLDQEMSPLPGGRIVSWDGAESVPFTQRINDNNQDVSEKADYDAEINKFTLIDEYHRMWTASVLVKVDPRGGAVAVSGPSIVPKTPVAIDDWDTGSPWPGIAANENVPDAVSTAVQTWAEAYASGDPQQLTQAVADPDGNHMYTPLNNVKSVSTEVVAAAPKDLESTDVLLAQINLNIVWVGQDIPEGAFRDIPVSMDVLVVGADTASPRVVAWGDPGTAPMLEPYENSVPARPVDPPPVIEEGPTEEEKKAAEEEAAKRAAEEEAAKKAAEEEAAKKAAEEEAAKKAAEEAAKKKAEEEAKKTEDDPTGEP